MFERLCALKLEDVPGLAPLPSYEAAENFQPNARQRSVSASDWKSRFWDEQRRLKRLGLPTVLNDEIAVLLLEEVDPLYRQEAVTMTQMSDMRMTGYFNPDKSNATRRQVYMPIWTRTATTRWARRSQKGILSGVQRNSRTSRCSG